MNEKTETSPNSNKTIGPWDVAIFLVQRFPVLAIIIFLFAATTYGVRFFQDERNVALTQLLEAQEKFARLEADTREQLDTQQKLVNEALSSAREMEKDAAKIVAEARANALADVQDTLMSASERIQQLVLGQLQSIDDLEKIRATTVTELKNQQLALQSTLSDLTFQHDQLEYSFEKAKSEYENAKIVFPIDQLENDIEERKFRVKSSIEDVFLSYQENPEITESIIVDRISKAENSTFSGVLKYILATQNGSDEWINKFVEVFDQGSDSFDLRWFEELFSCCSDAPDKLWAAMLPSVVELALDESKEFDRRIESLQFFESWPGGWHSPILSFDAHAQNAELWRTLEFLIGVIRDGSSPISAYEHAQILDIIRNFDAAAAHVWYYQLRWDDRIGSAAKSEIDEAFEFWVDDYPTFRNSPRQEFVDFWVEPDLAINMHNYENLNYEYFYIRE